MARDLIEEDQASGKLLAAAEDRLEIPLRRHMLEGPAEGLQATEHAQPAILFHSLALLEKLTAAGVRPAAVAGHSLGEFGALVAAGGLEPLDALAAVLARGRAMADAAPSGTGMAAVLGLADDVVERICADSRISGTVVAANFNAPGQVVISGSDEALSAIVPRLQAAGAKGVIPLPVSAAFHSPLMEEAATRFKEAWEKVPLHAPRLPQVFNADAAVHEDPGEIRALMLRQLTGPVRWSASVRRLAEMDVLTFVEIGPKRTLTALVKKILPEAAIHNVEDLPSLQAFLAMTRA